MDFEFHSIPEWAEIVMEPDGDFERLSAYWYQLHTATKEMQKIKSGYLLKEILSQFTNTLFESKFLITEKLFMYFAHDVTIANMLHSLGFFEVITVMFSNNFFLNEIIFEMH